MSVSEFKRKLRAILSADVAGYSRLMGEDDEATVRTLTGHREMMSSIIIQNQGQVIDSPGDNLLAAFSSVTQAVDCAVEIQREMAERNAELSEDRKMEYRIGINLGEVIEEADRIYGDGVNIAARLESIAEPGGICISGITYTHVKNKLKLDYEFLGKQAVKNISEPVPVYCIKLLPKPAVHYGAGKEPISVLSEKPSIAVLPFVNMSKDPDQEYFSDGMSEEIISALAKLEGLKVISRTSAFHFKGKDTDLRTIGEKLNVEHVLEGSVRKAGNKLRITAQLIKVSDDTHLWADTYDRELVDVFAIQDEISQAVVKNLKVKLLGPRTGPLVKDYTQNTEAYELFLKANHLIGKTEYTKGIEYLKKVIKTDPSYVPAYSLLAGTYNLVRMLWGLSPLRMKPIVSKLLQKAIEIDENYAPTYHRLSMVKMYEYKWLMAEQYYKRAINLLPNHSRTLSGYSIYLAAMGRISEAIHEAKRSVELDPFSSFDRFFLVQWLAYDGQYDQAVKISKEMLELDENDRWGLSALATTYVTKDMYQEAISIAKNLTHIPYWKAVIGYFYGKIGKKKEAQKILDDFLEQSERGYFSPYMIAAVYSGMGKSDKVFEWLDRAYEVQDPNQIQIKLTDFFSDLHSDPRWQDVLKKRNLAD